MRSTPSATPRAVVFKNFVHQLADAKGRQHDFEYYNTIERLAPRVIAEKRHIYKGVSANVDFYSGFVYDMLDIPVELYTPIFAVARIVGWAAHRMEELTNMDKIIRPAYQSIMVPRGLCAPAGPLTYFLERPTFLKESRQRTFNRSTRERDTKVPNKAQQKAHRRSGVLFLSKFFCFFSLKKRSPKPLFSLSHHGGVAGGDVVGLVLQGGGDEALEQRVGAVWGGS